MNKTGINWCDYTFNPITGCTKIASGCKFCYAEGIAKRFWGDRKFTDIRFHPERLNDPKLRSKKPKRIFVNSMSDLFHEQIQDTEIVLILDTIKASPQHTFLVLTKRIKRAVDWNFISLPNLWLGYSASTQKDLEAGIDYLMQINAKVRWLSLEPLLEPIDLYYQVDWVVVGCESGGKRRYFNNAWVRDIIIDAKVSSRIPVWIKQIRDEKNNVIEDVNLFPKELQLRELPNNK